MCALPPAAAEGGDMTLLMGFSWSGISWPDQSILKLGFNGSYLKELR